MRERLDKQTTPDKGQENTIRQYVLDVLHVLFAFGVFLGALHLHELR